MITQSVINATRYGPQIPCTSAPLDAEHTEGVPSEGPFEGGAMTVAGEGSEGEARRAGQPPPEPTASSGHGPFAGH